MRRILLTLGVVILIALIAVPIFGPRYMADKLNPISGSDWPVSERAEALHSTLTIADLHADPLLWDRDLTKRDTIGHVDLPRLREGGVALQVFTTVTKSPRGQNYETNAAGAADNITPLFIGQLRPPATWFSLLERALDQAAKLRALETTDGFVLIRTRADLAKLAKTRATGSTLIGGILGAEGGHALEGDLANLDRLYAAGFRMIGLTHFFDNELGGSLHGADHSFGLTAFGREVVMAMQSRGMIVDLAHASPQMVRDVLAIDGVAPIVSHTGIHGHCATPRNIDDKLMQAIAQRGGVIGIGFWQDVVCGDTPAAIAEAIRAAVDLVGINHVALGSDFDGSVDAPFDVAGLPALTQALIDEGFSDGDIAAIMGGNVMRYLARHLPEG